jgi:hypothetical protein
VILNKGLDLSDIYLICDRLCRIFVLSQF